MIKDAAIAFFAFFAVAVFGMLIVAVGFLPLIFGLNPLWVLVSAPCAVGLAGAAYAVIDNQ